jgi:hypothetical protein
MAAPCECGGAPRAAGGDGCRAERGVVGCRESGELRRRYVSGFLPLGERKVPLVSTRLSARDVIGGWGVRWGIGRMRYRVPPGLYAVGRPGAASPVLVTANYKLTFDSLRRHLGRSDAWILVLDTSGVNVWCAAGKGTFGTDELVDKIRLVALREVCPGGRIVLPQLGAPGVAAHEVRRQTGYPVVFGPVRAADVPRFLSGGFRKDEGMREARFGLADRMAVAPLEAVHVLPPAAALLGAGALLALPLSAGTLERVARVSVPLLGALLAGTVVFAALLPWLPFRAFALKGAVLGVLWSAAASAILHDGPLGWAARMLLIAPIVSFLAMNFTGSTTFTSLSGAQLEVRRSLVPMAASLLIGILLGIPGGLW